MTDILEAAPQSSIDPQLLVRRAAHVSIWSVWAVLDGSPSEEIFEGVSEEDATNWIKMDGQAWLDERRQRRKG